MKRDDVIRMALKAGLGPITVSTWYVFLENFANLVAAAERDSMEGTHTCSQYCQRPACVETRKAVAAEREACADLCEGFYDTAQAARAIRARGEK